MNIAIQLLEDKKQSLAQDCYKWDRLTRREQNKIGRNIEVTRRHQLTEIVKQQREINEALTILKEFLCFETPDGCPEPTQLNVQNFSGEIKPDEEN